MPTDEDALFSQLLEVFDRFKHIRHLEKQQGMPLNPSERGVLMHLAHHIPAGEQGLKMTQLSTLLRLAPPTVTPLIDSLEREGYVERVPDSRDRRVVLVRPTPQGERYVCEAKKYFNERLKKMVEYLGKDDTEELIRLMKKVYSYFDQVKNTQQ